MTTRAAIYLRISLDAAMDGLAIDRQRQDCEALAEQRGWDVVHTYVDQSISASKKDVDRPDYDAMVASFERGEIDGFWNAKARSYFTVNRCHTSTVTVNGRTQRSINTRGGQKSIAELSATNLPGTKDSYYYNFC
ncbi:MULTISPECIES: recombinase family protein [Actinomycetes]|uniref:Recombinase family protein n=2 Tax=Corynebacterium TaxID=1716 RepID=A0ABT4R9H6_9CORY|nr:MULTISPECIES: recombinase family protein [Actinomycetes]MCG7235212.1 recombinase family protein [Corynebacterium sp. ACRQP]MCG7288656.1 recombinase family protein [Corynebacterium sp. ACRPZ]MCG7293038.1 recombinase family protein [Corynebacterium sp. ACRPY]MCG7443456.1 recombinase family protein [Dermabacter vaginalis]MCZ9292206.1 recombinase family protein [Corynebacterium lehmanniae]